MVALYIITLNVFEVLQNAFFNFMVSTVIIIFYPKLDAKCMSSAIKRGFIAPLSIEKFTKGT